MLLCMRATANDGVFFVSGNQLVPLAEADIAITREVLTISLTDNGTASVDVWDELENRGKAKTVLMGFEADAPYNAKSPGLDGRHPNINDFRVELNGKVLPYKTAIVKPDIQEGGIQPIDLSKVKDSPDWEDYGNVFVSQKTDSFISYACAYYFPAKFRKGKNTVHHTYEYTLSDSLNFSFELIYKLTPANRWANHQIDDFTLLIKADHTAKHFVIEDDAQYAKADFRVTEGKGKVRGNRNKEATFKEVTLRDGTLEWHCENFHPQKELKILSADVLQSASNPPLCSFYDRSKGFTKSFTFRQQLQEQVPEQLPDEKRRILHNLPYAHRGYVFKDTFLNSFFNSLWWYMPDANWQPSADGFTAEEKQLIIL